MRNRLMLLGVIVSVLLAGVSLVRSAGESVLVAVNKYGDTVTFFDTRTNTRLASIPVAAHPHEIAISPDGRTAYVSIYGDGIYGRNTNPGRTITVIDIATRTKTGDIDLGDLRAPHAMDFDRQGRLWVACDSSATVAVIDTKERKVVGRIPTESTGSHWFVMLPDGKKAYTSNKDTTHMSVIDVASMKMTGKIPMPNGSDGLTASRDGKRLYVADLRQPLLHVIDTATDQEISTVSLKTRPMRVRLTPDQRHALVSQSGAGSVEVVDLAALQSRGSITVGKNPMGFAFLPGENRIWVTNHDDGTISALDLEQMKVVTTFPSDAGTETMEVVSSNLQ